MTTTVDALRKNGYKVRVCHVRRIKNPIKVEPSDFAPDGLDGLVTHYEYKQALESGTATAAVPWGLNLEACGGFCKIDIECPDGTKLRGGHKFNDKTPYSRKIGRNAALGRALMRGGDKVKV